MKWFVRLWKGLWRTSWKRRTWGIGALPPGDAGKRTRRRTRNRGTRRAFPTHLGSALDLNGWSDDFFALRQWRTSAWRKTNKVVRPGWLGTILFVKAR